MWWRLLKKSTNDGSMNIALFLICLGICDLAIIILFLLNYTLPSLCTEVTMTTWYAFYYSYIGFPTFFLFTSYSVWFIVVISLLRFLMIIYPMHRFRISKEMSYKMILAVLIFGFVVNTPHFLTIKPKFESNSTISITLSEFGRSINVMNYNFWSHCALFVVTPWFIIVTLNIGIIRKLRNKPPNCSNERIASEKKVTYVLLTVTFTFLGLLCWQCLSQCLFVIKTIASYSGPEWFYMEESVSYSKLGVAVNSCLNCVLYCITGKRFREEIGSMVGKRSSSISSHDPTQRATYIVKRKPPSVLLISVDGCAFTVNDPVRLNVTSSA